jgi:hypothetical protein
MPHGRGIAGIAKMVMNWAEGECCRVLFFVKLLHDLHLLILTLLLVYHPVDYL